MNEGKQIALDHLKQILQITLARCQDYHTWWSKEELKAIELKKAIAALESENADN